MIEPQLPEMADGGYWYVSEQWPSVSDDSETFTPPRAFWPMEVEGVPMTVVRTFVPVPDIPASAVSVDQAFAVAGVTTKPHVRTGAP